MKTLDIENPFGAPVYHKELVSSTFDAAKILVRENAAHGTVIAADQQEAGRGRLGRSWKTEKAKNLLFTIALRYKDFASIPEVLTLRSGLAVSLAIEDLVSPCGSSAGEIKIKWPNDIMIGSRKAAGILAEADGKNVYVGIGVNVAQKEFPEEYRAKAVSIIQAYPGIPKDARFLLLRKILFRLYEEIENAQSSWRERLDTRLYKKGERVSFAQGSAGSKIMTEGTLSGVGVSGELLIVPEGGGKELSFVTGELLVYG